MFRQRIAGNGLLGCLRQINIIGDILDVPAVIHPGEEELLGVAENDGADAAFFEPAVLLDMIDATEWQSRHPASRNDESLRDPAR